MLTRERERKKCLVALFFIFLTRGAGSPFLISRIILLLSFVNLKGIRGWGGDARRPGRGRWCEGEGCEE